MKVTKMMREWNARILFLGNSWKLPVKVSGGSLAQLTRLLAAIVELEAYLSERTNAKEALFSTSSVDNKLIQYLICIHYLLLLD
jgi:hypothetical protein